MFCPACGYDCKDAKYCPLCGAKLLDDAESTPQAAPAEIPSLKEPYCVAVTGHEVDLNRLIRIYGTGIRKVGAYAYLQSTCKVSRQEAQDILDPVYVAHAGDKVSFMASLAVSAEAQGKSQQAEKAAKKQRIAELEASGKVYCPKCLSTEVTAQKKGFGFVRGALGAAVGLDVGMIAGGIGSKKIVLTCLKCGYQWKPGKK